MYLKYLRYTTTILEYGDKIVAYYSLANDLLKIDDKEDFEAEIESHSNLGSDYTDTFYNQLMYPAAKIGRLAIDKRFQRQGIGTLLINALVQSFVKKNKTGCQFITIDALNKAEVLEFYRKNGFIELTINDVQKDSRQMYKSLLEYIILED